MPLDLSGLSAGGNRRQTICSSRVRHATYQTITKSHECPIPVSMPDTFQPFDTSPGTRLSLSSCANGIPGNSSCYTGCAFRASNKMFCSHCWTMIYAPQTANYYQQLVPAPASISREDCGRTKATISFAPRSSPEAAAAPKCSQSSAAPDPPAS